MTIRDLFATINSDIDIVIARFGGNEGLLDRFVRKFPQDPNFGKLQAAMAEQDYGEIERSAHTLKGLAANLGFTELGDISSELVSAVRKDKVDHIEPIFDRLEQNYKRIIECIGKLECV